MKPAARVLLGAGIACGLAQAGPSVASYGPLRRAFLPALSGQGNPRHVALTFDDGPDPRSTPQFLSALDRTGWRATFFMLGSMVDAAPKLAAEVAAAGHEIAVHGYCHRAHILHSPQWVRDDLARGHEAVAIATGREPYWHRPPFGAISTGTIGACRRLDLRIVLWTSWGRDWRADATPRSVVADLTRTGLGGATLLLHDSDCTSAIHAWRSTLGALKPLAELVADQQLTAGPLGEHGI